VAADTLERRRQGQLVRGSLLLSRERPALSAEEKKVERAGDEA
jgi:hypothetical protein